MNIKNSQIRAHARHLLDDNIFGKDWLRGVLVVILMAATNFFIYELLLTIAGVITAALLLAAAALESVVLEYIILVFVYAVAMLLAFGITGPLNVGIATVYTDLVRNGENVRIGKFFCGFKNFFSNAILAIMYNLIVVLWSVFFIIPGIYVAYSYALAFHVRADHPEYRWKQCLDESERLMEGNRWKLFKLQFSHIGWFIIGLAFAGIGTFWAVPYLETSTAILYEEAKLEKSYK